VGHDIQVAALGRSVPRSRVSSRTSSGLGKKVRGGTPPRQDDQMPGGGRCGEGLAAARLGEVARKKAPRAWPNPWAT